MTIREARINKGLSQEDMARLLDITLRQYINIEQKKNLPNVKTGLRICEILELNPYSYWLAS